MEFFLPRLALHARLGLGGLTGPLRPCLGRVGIGQMEAAIMRALRNRASIPTSIVNTLKIWNLDPLNFS